MGIPPAHLPLSVLQVLLLIKSWFPSTGVRFSRTKERNCTALSVTSPSHFPAHTMAEGLCSHPTWQLQPGHIITLIYAHHFTCMRNPIGIREANGVLDAKCLLHCGFRNQEQGFQQVNKSQQCLSQGKCNGSALAAVQSLLYLCTDTSCLAWGVWEFKEALLKYVFLLCLHSLCRILPLRDKIKKHDQPSLCRSLEKRFAEQKEHPDQQTPASEATCTS